MSKFNGHVLCEFVMFFFDQILLNNLLYMTSLAIHLSILKNCAAIMFRFSFLSCFMRVLYGVFFL